MIKYDKYKPSGVEWIGEVPEGWHLKKIKFNFEIFAGATPKTENTEYWDGDIVWVTPADYKTSDVFVSKGERNITQKGYDSCNTQIVPKGSIVFSKRAPIGTVAISDVDLCTNQGCLTCVPKLSSSKYFYYAMSVFTEIFDLLGSGATFKEISSNSFSNVKLPSPSINEQISIASYLDNKCSKIDNVIGLQQKRIALLKELKQSTITKAVTKGLDKNAKMKYSGVEWIGEVPEGWEVKSFKYCVRINNGADYKSIETDDEYAYPVIGSGGIFAHATKFMYDGEVVFLGRKGTVDKPLYYVGKFWAIDTMFYAVPQKNTNGKYLYYQALTFPFDYYLTNTARPSMTQTDLGDNKIAVPPIAEQTVIVAYLDERCATIDRQITKIERQIELLKEYKQSVITDCVTGKRKVCQ